MTTRMDHFPTDTAGLPEAGRPELVTLSPGDEFDLRIAPVAKRLGESTVRMLAYNGSIPGPTLKVQEGSEIAVNVENQGDMETTVHWHGLRLENRYDGTPETQRPIGVGERYSARVTFPDPGVYWYHPHIREDYGQEMGLYANIVGRARRSRLLATGQPGGRAHARRHPAGGRQGRALQSRRDDLRGDGPLRRRAAGQR
jgi:FtsP/CotA-like multicopper oxidase with cupredoxin domain